ncbi:MAG: hypothetical protein WBW61_05785 [Rhodanobacteraceae bacterium]
MGEWSDFFEDFPEENPANWINGVYAGPNGAQLHRDHQAKVDAARRNAAAEQARLDSTIAKIIAAGVERQRLKERGS